MKKLGIIGGMGPLASQLLYREITEHTMASCDQEHIDMILLSHASMPDRTGAILSGDTEQVFRLLLKDAKMLEENGMGAIAIPCNTSHYFWDKLQGEVSVPVIHMVRKTVLTAKEQGRKRLGILATDGTILTGVYEKECQAAGVEYFKPKPEIQRLVMKIIYEQIKRGLPGNTEDFAKIDAHLRENGCDTGILACTELSCYRRQERLQGFYIDALSVLCREVITICGAVYQE